MIHNRQLQIWIPLSVLWNSIYSQAACVVFRCGTPGTCLIVLLGRAIWFWETGWSYALGTSPEIDASAALQGPRMVRDVFRMAKENAPAIIFIDEVDAIATSRFDAQTGADR